MNTDSLYMIISGVNLEDIIKFKCLLVKPHREEYIIQNNSECITQNIQFYTYYYTINYSFSFTLSEISLIKLTKFRTFLSFNMLLNLGVDVCI